MWHALHPAPVALHAFLEDCPASKQCTVIVLQFCIPHFTICFDPWYLPSNNHMHHFGDLGFWDFSGTHEKVRTKATSGNMNMHVANVLSRFEPVFTVEIKIPLKSLERTTRKLMAAFVIRRFRVPRMDLFW